MRASFAVNLESRDGTTTKDAKVVNGIVETKGDKAALRKRPGLSDVGLMRAGVAQALGYWNQQLVSITGDYINLGLTAVYTHVTTWNPSDIDSDVSLSAANLAAQYTNNGASAGGVRSSYALSSGLWYFELTVNTSNGQQGGIANATKSLNENPSLSQNSLTYSVSGSIAYNNTVLYSGLAAWNAGKILGVLVDADNRTVKFYVNNALQATVTSASVPTGSLYAYFGVGANNGTSKVTANFGTSFTYTPTISSTGLSPNSAGLQFSMQDNGSNSPGGSLLMVKNREQGWYVNNTPTVTQITDVDYPGKYAVTLQSLTRSGTVATATTTSDTNFQVGASVTIAGANESSYNGTFTITAVTPSISNLASPVGVTITRSGTTATATCTTTPHGLATGDTVTISGAEQSQYNGAHTVTVSSPTVFTFTVTVAGSDYVSPATGSFITTQAQLPNNATPASYSVTSAVLTATFVGPHNLESGAKVKVILGYQDSNGLNGSFLQSGLTATKVDAFSVTVPVAGVPNLSYLGAGPLRFSYPPVVAGDATQISSITGDGVTATATTSSAHNWTSGASVSIILSGCNQAYYNVYQSVRATVTGTSTFTYPIASGSVTPATPATGTITAQGGLAVTGPTFTYTVSGSPTTPATGTITATSGRNTVPGIAYMDGYFVVMDVFGVIYSSALNDPSTWGALDYIVAQAETGAGRYIGRTQSYIAALKEWSTEFFYNAGNATGSPFSPVPNAFTQVGCASGSSIAKLDGALIWLSQTREKGRSVHLMSGIQQTKLSTPDVERILNADDLAEVYAWGVKLHGHSLYVLTLVTSNITLALDLTTQIWSQWSTLTLGSSVSVSSITRSGTTATVTTGTAHGLSDGDPVYIAGADQSDYNGIFQITYVSTTQFTIQVANSPATPATGTITAAPYTESYFKFTHYANGAGVDYVLNKSDGHVYKFQDAIYQDSGAPINVFARTPRLDGGDTGIKECGQIVVLADKVSDTLMVRWSEDDSSTFSTYRPVDLSGDRPRLRRNGSFRRRSFEARHIGNNPLRLEAVDIDLVED